MKLGFHYHVPFTVDNSGNYYTSGPIGIFIDGISNNVDELIIFVYEALISETQFMDYKIKTDNVKIIFIGKHTHLLKRLFIRKKTRELIYSHCKKLDHFLIRAPSPKLPFFSLVCCKLKVPFGFLIVGDYEKSLTGTSMPFYNKVILSIYFKINKYLQDKYSSKAIVFANNLITFREYSGKVSNVNLVQTTTLMQSDIDLEPKVKQFKKNKIDLLCVGRIQPGKGVEDAIDTLAILRKDKVLAYLNIVGWEDKEGYIALLESKAKSLGVLDYLIFHGKKRIGKDLFDMYRAADIFLMTSNANEGFPRTIWESAANSTPIIATRIGPVSEVLVNGKDALIVNTNSPLEIANAVLMLINNKNLRAEVTKNALNLVKSNSIENQTKHLIDKLENNLNE